MYVFIHVCRTFGQGRELICHLISSFHDMSSRKRLFGIKGCGATWSHGGMFVMPTSCLGNVISRSSKMPAKLHFGKWGSPSTFRIHISITMPRYHCTNSFSSTISLKWSEEWSGYRKPDDARVTQCSDLQSVLSCGFMASFLLMESTWGPPCS